MCVGTCVVCEYLSILFCAEENFWNDYATPTRMLAQMSIMRSFKKDFGKSWGGGCRNRLSYFKWCGDSLYIEFFFN